MERYSKQREAIKENLINRYDHPTADDIYNDVRIIYPNISLGTVYRNLSMLVEKGEILKLATDGGPDRFDGDIKPHYHFYCRSCDRVMDIKTPMVVDIDAIMDDVELPGKIDNYKIEFYGRCRNCLNIES